MERRRVEGWGVAGGRLSHEGRRSEEAATGWEAGAMGVLRWVFGAAMLIHLVGLIAWLFGYSWVDGAGRGAGVRA